MDNQQIHREENWGIVWDGVIQDVRSRWKRLVEIRDYLTYPDQHNSATKSGSSTNRSKQPGPPQPWDTSVLDQIPQDTTQAGRWLVRTIFMRAKTTSKPQMYFILRSAILKTETERNDLEQLFLILTNPEPQIPMARFTAALITVLEDGLNRKYGGALEDQISETERDEDTPEQIPQHIRDRVLDKAQSSLVDGFACAIPLSNIKALKHENDHICPICCNSYLDFESFSIENLIADYPVRIKFCGHVIGKSCLETWLMTPLVDPAKYPVRTCPICRTQIEDRDDMPAPVELSYHIDRNEWVRYLSKTAALDREELESGIKRLVSEEIVLQELRTEIMASSSVSQESIHQSKGAMQVVEAKLQEALEERSAWGFDTRLKLWERIKSEWMNILLTDET